MRVDVKDFGKISDGKFNGEVVVSFEKADYKEYRSGADGLSIRLKILGVTKNFDLDEYADPTGLSLFTNMVYPNASQNDGGTACGQMLKRMVEAFGGDYDDGGFDTEDLINREAIAVCRLEEYPKGSGEYNTAVTRFKKLI